MIRLQIIPGLFFVRNIFFLYALVHLLAVNGNMLWRLYADARLAVANGTDGDSNFIAYHQGLADSPSQYQHDISPQ